MKRELEQIDHKALHAITGGATLADISLQMGPPKYSAAWWDFVRTRPGTPK